MIDFDIPQDGGTDMELARQLMQAEADKLKPKGKKQRHPREEQPGKKRARARFAEKQREDRFYKRLAKGLVHIDNRGWVWRKQPEEFGIISITSLGPAPDPTPANQLIQQVLREGSDPIAIAAIKSVLGSS